MSIFKRTLAIFFAVAVFVFSMNISACASSELSLTVECAYNEEPFADVEVRIYLVAKENRTSEFELAEEFEKYSVLINNDKNSEQLRAAALALASYAERDNITPYDYCKTDINGSACFPVNANRLEQGIYLVAADDYTREGSTSTAEPFLVFLPDENADGKVSSNVITKPKFFDKETFLSTSVKVLKVWEDDETQRPEEIEVELICNGKIVDTAVLNEEMNWRCTWDNLESGDYLVCEKNVPEGYEVSISLEGITFVIKNTAKETPTVEGDPQPVTTESQTEPKLPQTGMLKWPVPYLACAGLLFLLAGWAINRKNELENEK